jgi:hypothetical protein
MLSLVTGGRHEGQRALANNSCCLHRDALTWKHSYAEWTALGRSLSQVSVGYFSRVAARRQAR